MKVAVPKTHRLTDLETKMRNAIQKLVLEREYLQRRFATVSIKLIQIPAMFC
jgi:hypothetical protein